MPQASNSVIAVFSARACAAPLEEAAKIFEKETGVRVAIDVCSRHCASAAAEEATGTTGGDDFLDEIADAKLHDCAIGGAEFLLDDGEVRGIVQRGKRRTIGYRRSCLVVPTGNPAGVKTMADLAKPGMRVGISVIDCCKGMWEDVSARAGLLEAIRPNITFYANGCVAIVEAVATRKVDVAFGWAAFHHLQPGRIEVVELAREQQIFRGTGIALLSFSRNPAAATKFMDFLTTPAARACYVKYGWVVKP